MRVPSLSCALLEAFGASLYARGSPLYMYLMTLTAIVRLWPRVAGELKPAWRVATVWETLQPVTHRPPLPRAFPQQVPPPLTLLHYALPTHGLLCQAPPHVAPRHRAACIRMPCGLAVWCLRRSQWL